MNHSSPQACSRCNPLDCGCECHTQKKGVRVTETLTKLPTRQELRLIKRMAFVMPPMALSFGIRGDRSLIHIIGEYRRDPERFDTYLDPVAVDRAMRGDRKVWENLTHYERRHVLQRADEVPEWIRETVWQVGHQQISRAKKDEV